MAGNKIIRFDVGIKRIHSRHEGIKIKFIIQRIVTAKMQSVVFHFTGRNLWTLTDFTGYDPEYENNGVYTSYPNTRMYEFGVEVTF